MLNWPATYPMHLGTVDQNTYLRYKRDQEHLVYWIIHASNRIIASLPSDSSAAANTTGQISLSTLISLSGLIAEHISPIPTTIYRLFRSIINARKETHALFQQIVSNKPDPEIEKSNASHKFWIDGLTEAFKVLGGDKWFSEQKPATKADSEEDEDEVIFSNKFSMLELKDEDKEDGEEDQAEEEVAAPVQRQKKQRAPGKGKKNKRGKKAKGGRKHVVDEPKLESVPLESYRIIEDETGLVTDYLMAVYSLYSQLVQLRHYLQRRWQEVAYDGLNSAVAGTLSKVGIQMIHSLETKIFLDFPGHDSFETVMNTITRGDPEKTQNMFHMSLQQVGPGMEAKTVQEVGIDIKEEFLIYAYRDLLDFILDFQKMRSGKSTKRMLKEIQNWDPTLDLRRTSKEERLNWRRAYTINWLYDLVNVFSSIVVQRITLKGQKIDLEKVDWSIYGEWHVHRRLYGLNEFAGAITALAMQKPGTDIRQKILPHHVFQLQCIVDSMTVSRGWSIHNFRGHVLTNPAPDFRPRRDVDLFLDRNNERVGQGFCFGVDILGQCLEEDAMLHGDPNRHRDKYAMLTEIRDEFVDWLGESKYAYGLDTIPPSCFSSTSANGLWEYSPFLCGVGLMEALELAYAVIFKIWENITEPTNAIHLHNMLVQKGYIKQPVGLYASLESLFQKAFFANGVVPKSNFQKALLDIVTSRGSRRGVLHRRATQKHIARNANDVHELLDLDVNHFINTRSLLGILRRAGWDPDRISDDEVPFPSALLLLRLGHTKRVRDPTTGAMVMESTEIVKRVRAMGIRDEDLIKMASILDMKRKDNAIPESFQATLPKDFTLAPRSGYKIAGSDPDECGLDNQDVLGFLKEDILSDVCGELRPLSSLNYPWATARMMILFREIEEELKRRRNPVWIQAYEENPMMADQKRATFTTLVMDTEDEECLQVIAKAFQNPRARFISHIYWDNLESPTDRKKSTVHNDPIPSCSIM